MIGGNIAWFPSLIFVMFSSEGPPACEAGLLEFTAVCCDMASAYCASEFPSRGGAGVFFFGGLCLSRNLGLSRTGTGERDWEFRCFPFTLL